MAIVYEVVEIKPVYFPDQGVHLVTRCAGTDKTEMETLLAYYKFRMPQSQFSLIRVELPLEDTV